jgi:CIC family chloride channel protein
LRNVLADYVRKLPVDLRTYILPFLYGLFGGLAAVAFQKLASILFSMLWEKPSQQMPPGTFTLCSLAAILAASIIAGLILTFVSRDAAGSGIPQAKVAFWRDFGFMPVRVVIAKFFAGADLRNICSDVKRFRGKRCKVFAFESTNVRTELSLI